MSSTLSTSAAYADTSTFSPPDTITVFARRLAAGDTGSTVGADDGVALIPPNDILHRYFLPPSASEDGWYYTPVSLIPEGNSSIPEAVEAHERSPDTHPLRIASTTPSDYPPFFARVLPSAKEGWTCSLSFSGGLSESLTSFGRPTAPQPSAEAVTRHSLASDHYAHCVRADPGRAPLMYLKCSKPQPIDDSAALHAPYRAVLHLGTATDEKPQWYTHSSALWATADMQYASLVIEGQEFPLHQPGGMEPWRKMVLCSGLKAEFLPAGGRDR